ncbi:MAG: replication protein [Chloroflexales bacterium]
MTLDRPNYTQLPNALLDEQADLSDAELRVALAVGRRTFGWHREREVISLAALEAATGRKRPAVLAGIKALIARGWLERVPDGDSYAYRLLIAEPETTPGGVHQRTPRGTPAYPQGVHQRTPIRNKETGERKPPPPTPATAAPGGGGGGGGSASPTEPPPSTVNESIPDPPHPETIRLLAAAGVVTAADFGDIPPAIAQAAIDQAARHTNPRNGTAALVGGLLAKFRTGRWQPTASAPTERPPSDRVILEHPALDAQTRATWLARFRQAAEPAAKRGVLARLAEEVPYA